MIVQNVIVVVAAKNVVCQNDYNKAKKIVVFAKKIRTNKVVKAARNMARMIVHNMTQKIAVHLDHNACQNFVEQS